MILEALLRERAYHVIKLTPIYKYLKGILRPFRLCYRKFPIRNYVRRHKHADSYIVQRPKLLYVRSTIVFYKYSVNSSIWKTNSQIWAADAQRMKATSIFCVGSSYFWSKCLKCYVLQFNNK